MIGYLLGLTRKTRQLLLILADTILLPMALWAAFSLRLGEAVPSQMVEWYWSFLFVPMASLPVFYSMGLYKTVVRFMGYEALWKVFAASTLFLLIWGGVVLMLADQFFPRSVIIIYWMAVLTVVGGIRVVARQLIIVNQAEPSEKRKRIAIFGAGSAGVQLLSATRVDSTLQVRAFIDDSGEFVGHDVAGIPVFHSNEIAELQNKRRVDEVWVALPSVTHAIQNKVLEKLEPYPFRVKTLPSLHELIHGEVSLEDVRDVTVEDLLGRGVVAPDAKLLEEAVQGKSILITGAGGSIGSELARQIIKLSPSALVLLDHSEFNLYTIAKELEKIDPKKEGFSVKSVLGSIQNREYFHHVVQQYKIDTLFHAAAYKHVPLVEHNPFEAVLNNVIGTRIVAEVAQACGVERFVLISTDKAVHPTNVMGATKRVAELILQALSSEQVDDEAVAATRFCMVRFGNVLGSSGSVVPLFQDQIRNGGPVTVTHPEVTRYFMTIPEAVQLVIQAGSIAEGGDLFVLDMGEPVRIVDLALRMIHLSGFKLSRGAASKGEIEVVYTGLRPGEKLYEELLIGENIFTTLHPKIMRARENFISWQQLSEQLDQLEECAQGRDREGLKRLLQSLVAGYLPSDHI